MSQETDDFLAHYGVKGMKWGVRKKKQDDAPRAEGYSDQMRKEDREDFGKKGVKRINQKMLDGVDRDKALFQEDLRKAATGMAVVAAMNLGPLAIMAAGNSIDRGYNKVQFETYKKQQRNGKAAATKMFSDKMGLTPVAAVDLAYNAARDIWE